MPEGESNPVVPLDYRPTPCPRTARLYKLRRRLRTLPSWLFAVLLLLPVLSFDELGLADRVWPGGASVPRPILSLLYAFALFLPGSVRRWDWRAGAEMLALAVVWWGTQQAMLGHPLPVPFPYSYPLWAACTVSLVGLGEWFLARPRLPRSLLWLTVLSVAAGCALALLCQPLQFDGGVISLPRLGGSQLVLSWGTFLNTPLLTVLTWLAVPAGLALGRAGTPARRRGSFAAAGSAVALFASFVLFFHVFLYPLARRSLAGGGPFSRSAAISLLLNRDSPRGRDELWRVLEDADWSRPEETTNGLWDYRLICISGLAERDRSDTAHRLSRMLLDHPSITSASFSAKLLAEQHCDEAVPVLLRYALLLDDKCGRAVEAMRVPWAALVLIREAYVYDQPKPQNTNFTIRPDRRQRLALLLGKDAGPRISDWTEYYDRVADGLPTHLPGAVANEAKRVVAAMERYGSAHGRLYEAECRLSLRRWERDGKGGDALRPANALGMGAYRDQARADLAVAPPDWNARGAAELEKTVAEYAKRVDARISEWGLASPPSTSPSTTPSPGIP